jgi:hypothetical protein
VTATERSRDRARPRGWRRPVPESSRSYLVHRTAPAERRWRASRRYPGFSCPGCVASATIGGWRTGAERRPRSHAECHVLVSA